METKSYRKPKTGARPAKASKGYIDMMREHAKGEMVHEYIQIGWWKLDEVFLPVVIE